MKDRYIKIKKGKIQEAINALSEANLSFVVSFYDCDGKLQETGYFQSKMNTYNEKTRFSKSIGCKNIPEAINKFGSRQLFEQKFAESYE